MMIAASTTSPSKFSAWPDVSTSMWSLGNNLRNSGSLGIRRCVPNNGKTPSRNRYSPPSPASSSTISASDSSTGSTAAINTLPSEFRYIACDLRSNSGFPIKSSSALIRRLSAGGESDNSLAAALADPNRAVRTNASKERRGGKRRIVNSILIMMHCSISAW